MGQGGVLNALLPLADAVLKEFSAAASTREQDVVRSLIMKRQLAAQASASRYRALLYATSLLLLAVLVYPGLQLRPRAIALRRRAALGHRTAGISMSFINVRPQQ